MLLPDPFDLAKRQVAIDGEVIAEDGYRARKQRKLALSPFGFFRGSARLFYELLRDLPELSLPDGSVGPIVGDMHLENVGAYRTDADEIAFDLNDFDDATNGPHWFDTLRLATSVLLAGRSFQASAPESLSLANELLRAYEAELDVQAAGPNALMRAMAVKPIAELCERARKRTRKELLEMRAPLIGGKRSFVRGERYHDLTEREREQLPMIVDAYKSALGSRAPSHAKSWSIVDAAHRVAGTGSLGRLRIAFLVVDSTGTERLFEFKEAAPSAAEVVLGRSSQDPSTRMLACAEALAEHPPRQLAALGTTALGALCGRKLCPEEDKLDLAKLHVGPKLSAVVRVVGETLARAHGRSSAPSVPHAGALLDRAVYLAGIFESVYLAYARMI